MDNIRDHLEIVISAIAAILSVAALVISIAHHKRHRQGLFGTLVLYILSFYDVIFILEVLLHIAFCTQFYIYLKKKRAFLHENRLVKTNQIIFFQAISQAILCLVPKICTYVNKLFFNGKLQWVLQIEDYFVLLYSMNISIVTVFIISTLRPKRSETVSVHSNTGRSRVLVSGMAN
uniref:G protein-coupled receptor n=1 Tax=Steinernema glaseri TaxID=37863 RepID=A0A1I8A897_9BILA